MDLNGTVDLQSNSTSIDFGDSPAFVAYNFIMFFAVLFPIAVMDVLLLVALCVEKATPAPIKIVLVNLLLGALAVSVGICLEHTSAMVLSFVDIPNPNNDFCHFIVWMLAGGGATRMLFTALFAIVVFILVRSGAKSLNTKVLFAVSIGLWIAAFVVSSPLLSPVVVGSQFLGKTACIPKNVAISSRFGYLIYNPIWVILCGVIPLGITIAIPLVTAYYLKTRNITGNVKFKKAMVKFALFLLIGIIIGFIGQVVPPLLLSILFRNMMNVDSPLAIYMTFILMNLSLVPTPILILVYLTGARNQLREFLLCNCVRYKDETSRSTVGARSASIASKLGSLRRQNTGLSDVSLSRQNTGLSELALVRQDTGLSVSSLKRMDSETDTDLALSSSDHKRLSKVPEEHED